MFLGISAGNLGATDDDPSAFLPASSGAGVAAISAIYEFNPMGDAPGLGMIDQLIFTPSVDLGFRRVSN